MKVPRDGRQITVSVRADGDDQTVNHVCAALVAWVADGLGLTDALSAGLAGRRRRRGGHDPGDLVRDLAVMLADGATRCMTCACCATRTRSSAGSLLTRLRGA